MTQYESLIYQDARTLLKGSKHITEKHLIIKGEPYNKEDVLETTIQHLCLALSECRYKYSPKIPLSDFIAQFNYTAGKNDE